MRIFDNLWWMVLVVGWAVYGVIALTFGEILFALFAALSIATVVIGARAQSVYRTRIRILKAANLSLEQSLKEAHRR